MHNRQTTSCRMECPCKYDPVVMPVKECVCDRYFCVEQPVICPVNKRIVNHYVPKPVYYHTYSQCEENVCEPSPYANMGYQNTATDPRMNMYDR